MSLQTCIFDLGNVLVSFSHDRMVRNIACASGVPEEGVREFLFERGFQEAIETGKVTEEQFHTEFIAHTNSDVSIDDIRTAVGDIFELNTEMLPLLEELRSLGIRLVLLSNTCVTHIEFVKQKWNFLTLFDAITTSWEVGAMKPDPLIYESALRQANCPAANCFFTDDIEDYVNQAVAMGIQAHVFRNAATTRSVLRELGIPLTSN
jgi:HAD superfamily hydrolase (TIGR01509 family)